MGRKGRGAVGAADMEARVAAKATPGQAEAGFADMRAATEEEPNLVVV